VSINLANDGSLPPGAHSAAPDDVRAAYSDSPRRLVVDAALASAARLRQCFDVQRILLGGDFVDPATRGERGRMLVCVRDTSSIEAGMLAADNMPLSLLTTFDAFVTFPYLPDEPVQVRASTLLPVGGLLDTALYLDHQLRRSQAYVHWLGGGGGYLEVTS